jgi:ribosomal protein S8
MINHDEPTKFDLRKSYSIDESVAKMLGWMKGKIRVETVIQDKYGPIPRHLPHLYTLQHPLETHLQLLLDRAKHEYNEALQDNEIAELYIEEMNPVDATSVRIASNYIVNEKYNEVTHWESVAKKALNYKIKIQEELEKKESPRLEIDQPISDESGIVHIKLNSLNEWAKQFGITIIDSNEGFVMPTEKHQEQSKQADYIEVKPESNQVPERVKRIRQRENPLSLEIYPILEVMPNPTAVKVMAELRKLIGTPDTCITYAVADGIEWTKSNGDIGTLTHKALAGRIAKWKKLPLA